MWKEFDPPVALSIFLNPDTFLTVSCDTALEDRTPCWDTTRSSSAQCQAKHKTSFLLSSRYYRLVDFLCS